MARAADNKKSSSDPAPLSAASPPPGMEAADTGSVDKIRDILFGNQIRDFDKRFAQMEDRFAEATRDLRDETYKRLETLEQFFKKELDSLKSSLKSEAEERTEGDDRLHDEVKNTAATLKKTIAQAEEKFSETTTELRQQILDQSKSLTMEIQTKSEQASDALRKNVGALNEAKIDRSALSEYLVEMAMRLSGEPDNEAARNEDS